MTYKSSQQRGQAIAEYLILTALIAIGSIAIIQVISKNLKVGLASVSDALQGKTSSQRQGVDAEEKHFKMNDMGDFNNAIRDNKDN